MDKILFLLGMVAVSLNVRGVNILDRPLTEREKHSFCEVMNLSSFQVVDRFAKCSRSNIEGKSIDGRLHNLLVDVASNQHGKRMLSFVIAKVEPSVKCAKTLMYMSEILSFPSDKSVKCALNFLDELIPFSDASDLERKLCKIKKARDDLLINPKEFSCKEDENVLEKIGLDKRLGVQDFFFKNMHGLKRVIDPVIPLLLEKVFDLKVGINAFLLQDNIISVSVNDTVISNLVTGPLLCYAQFGRKIHDSVICQRMLISKDVYFIHELSHYVRKVFDGVIAPDLIPFLYLDFLPSKYVANSLDGIFSNSEEFRNITGIMLYENKLFFDPMTEAGYVLKNNKRLRASHNFGFVSRAPIQLIEKIKELSGEEYPLQEGEVEYSELWNLW